MRRGSPLYWEVNSLYIRADKFSVGSPRHNNTTITLLVGILWLFKERMAAYWTCAPVTKKQTWSALVPILNGLFVYCIYKVPSNWFSAEFNLFQAKWINYTVWFIGNFLEDHQSLIRNLQAQVDQPGQTLSSWWKYNVAWSTSQKRFKLISLHWQRTVSWLSGTYD